MVALLSKPGNRRRIVTASLGVPGEARSALCQKELSVVTSAGRSHAYSEQIAMTHAARRLPPPRIESVGRELLRVLSGYLLLVFVMQCLWALPPGLHTLRHSHSAAGAPAPGSVFVRAAERHAHDGEFHTHDSTTADLQLLGEAGDEASVTPAPALWACAWPAAPLFMVATGRETFTRAGAVRFSSRSTRVPLQPPQRG